MLLTTHPDPNPIEHAWVLLKRQGFWILQMPWGADVVKV